LRQKERALLLLKLRKYKEKELDNVDNQLLSVFKMIEDIEWEAANMEVLKALKVGTEALNKFHEEMSVEDVEALLDETNEAIEVRTAPSQTSFCSHFLY
jgi:charged multivesicular body protein 6